MPDSAPSRSSAVVSKRLRLLQSPRAWSYALWKFSRPHTIIGTSLSVGGLFAIAVLSTPSALSGPSLGILLGLTWLACLLGNLYIVGLNQLEDIDIDRINKPHLPLASGEFSRSDGRWIVGLAGGLALLLALFGGVWLLAVVGVSLMIGTAYSVPPLRLKRFPFWASICILAVRGAIVNLGLYLHYQHQFGNHGYQMISPVIWALTGFIVLFSIAIALLKDIPDIEGDRRYNISTFSVKLGQRAVFNLARLLLTLCYGGMVIISPWINGVNRPFWVGSHLVAIAVFWVLSRRVNQGSPAAAAPRTMSYADFYQFIWKLFFLEYLMVPVACWLA